MLPSVPEPGSTQGLWWEHGSDLAMMLLHLANKNARHPVKCEFLMNNGYFFISVNMFHAIFGTYLYKKILAYLNSNLTGYFVYSLAN